MDLNLFRITRVKKYFLFFFFCFFFLCIFDIQARKKKKRKHNELGLDFTISTNDAIMDAISTSVAQL